MCWRETRIGSKQWVTLALQNLRRQLPSSPLPSPRPGGHGHAQHCRGQWHVRDRFRARPRAVRKMCPWWPAQGAGGAPVGSGGRRVRVGAGKKSSGRCQVSHLSSRCLLYPPAPRHPGPPHFGIRWGKEVRGHGDRPLRLEAVRAGKRPELLVSKAPCPHLKAGQVCLSDTSQSGGKGQSANSAHPPGGRTFLF